MQSKVKKHKHSLAFPVACTHARTHARHAHHTHTHTHTHARTHARTHTHMHARTHALTHTHTHTHTQLHVSVYRCTSPHTYMHAYHPPPPPPPPHTHTHRRIARICAGIPRKIVNASQVPALLSQSKDPMNRTVWIAKAFLCWVPVVSSVISFQILCSVV